MSKHHKEAAFLECLIGYEDSDECRRFQERLAKAEREVKCLKRALLLVGMLAMFCAAGLGYSAVLLDDFFRNKTHPATQFFLGLGTTSIIALVFFVGHYLWHRALIHRLHQECRGRILSVVQSRLGPPAAGNLETTQLRTEKPAPVSEVLSFPKAS